MKVLKAIDQTATKISNVHSNIKITKNANLQCHRDIQGMRLCVPATKVDSVNQLLPPVIRTLVPLPPIRFIFPVQ